MKPLEILAFVIMAIGFGIVYGAKAIVKKYNLAQKQNCMHTDEMSEEEVEQFKLNKATFNIKIIGLVVSIPGIVLLILSSKI